MSKLEFRCGNCGESHVKNFFFVYPTWDNLIVCCSTCFHVNNFSKSFPSIISSQFTNAGLREAHTIKSEYTKAKIYANIVCSKDIATIDKDLLKDSMGLYLEDEED